MMSSLWSRGSGRNLPFFSNCFQQPPHFGSRSNGDAHKSRSDVFAPVAEQNSLLLQFLKKCGTAWPEICEKKISGARVSLHAERHQFCAEPPPQLFHSVPIPPHLFPLPSADFPCT